MAGRVPGQSWLVRTWNTVKLWNRRAAERDELRCAGSEVWRDLGPARVDEEVCKSFRRE